MIILVCVSSEERWAYVVKMCWCYFWEGMISPPNITCQWFRVLIVQHYTSDIQLQQSLYPSWIMTIHIEFVVREVIPIHYKILRASYNSSMLTFFLWMIQILLFLAVLNLRTYSGLSGDVLIHSFLWCLLIKYSPTGKNSHINKFLFPILFIQKNKDIIYMCLVIILLIH